MEQPSPDKFIWQKNSLLVRTGITPQFLVSTVVSIALLFFLISMEYASVYSSTVDYFYMLNFIPAIVCFLMGLRNLKTHNIMDSFAYSAGDYILIKSIFKILEDTSFAVSGGLIGCVLVAMELTQRRRSQDYILLSLYSLQFLVLSLNLEDFFVVVIILAILLFSYSSKGNFFTRLWLVSIMYFIDLGINYKIYSALKHQNAECLRIPFMVYTGGVILYIFLHQYIERLSMSFSMGFFIFVVCINIKNRVYGWGFNFIDEYILRVAILMSISLCALTYITTRTRCTKTFPPTDQSFYEFAYCSMINWIEVRAFDKYMITISSKHLIPKTDSDEMLNIRLLDFKLIGMLHILNGIVRKKGSEITLEDARGSLMNFSTNFYEAFESSHYDDLDKEIENVIISIIDSNNDIISKFTHYVGFDKVGFKFPWFRNNFYDERNKQYALSIEESIRRGRVNNILFIKENMERR